MLAYNNFLDKKLSDLKVDFEIFKIENSSWLESQALFEILANKYQSEDFYSWNEIDRELFNSDFPIEKRNQRINELKEENKKEIDFIQFIQFIADKQQREAKKKFANKDIKIYGDCLIGFSPSEVWANKNCFTKGQYYGGPDPNCPETNGIQTWNLTALDYTKIGEFNGNVDELGESGKLLYKKYCQFFKRYDGLRMDAAWQFVTPFVYSENNGQYNQISLPQMDYIILDIMKQAAIDTLGQDFEKLYPDNIMLELVGMSADESRELTRNTYPHLYTTAYSQYDERPKKFLEKGYENGKFYVGAGCHDNETLVGMARNLEQREIQSQGFYDDYEMRLKNFEYNCEEFNSQNEELKTQENFRNAKFGEIFTSKNQFFTLVDAFGMSERINISGKQSSDNWSVRIPSDYEKFYHSQIQNGYGLNLPKAMLNALKMQGNDNSKLSEKLYQASELLRQTGAKTQNEADILEKEGKIGIRFKYDI